MKLRIFSLMVNIFVRALRILGFGGTALPGIWVEKYYPSLLSQYAKLYKTTIFITGTNGKTTVQIALKKVLESAGYEVTGNFSGSNMLRGIATTLLARGIPKQSANSILLCEVEEATMPKISQFVHPNIIVVTNMYRDQLDAYGELDKTAEYIKSACLSSPSATLVLNSDDPVITKLSTKLPHKRTTYSLGEYAKQFQYEGSLPPTERATATTSQVTATHIKLNADLSTETSVATHDKTIKLTFQPPGVYNVYNALAVIAVGQVLGIQDDDIVDSLAQTQTPFGRGETVSLTKDGKNLVFQIFLVKNPAGYSQVWDMLRAIHTPFNLILGLNDNVADGRDVSWIWDINLTPFVRPDNLQILSFTGKRAHDMALRLKYAEIEATTQDSIPSITTCLESMIQKSADGRHTFVLMTYTAMNQFRSALGQYVRISSFSS